MVDKIVKKSRPNVIVYQTVGINGIQIAKKTMEIEMETYET